MISMNDTENRFNTKDLFVYEMKDPTLVWNSASWHPKQMQMISNDNLKTQNVA